MSRRVFGVVPHVNRARELLGRERGDHFLPLSVIGAKSNELINFESGRLIEQLEQLSKVVMFKLNVVFLKKAITNIRNTPTDNIRTYAFEWIQDINCSSLNIESETVGATLVRIFFVPADMVAVFVFVALKEERKAQLSEKCKERKQTSFSQHLPTPQ